MPQKRHKGLSTGVIVLLVILVIALLIFGPSKLADLGKSLGEGIKGFKEAVRDDKGNPKP